MTSDPSWMIIAGEASGDQYGARVIEQLRARVPDAQFFGIGGDRMQEAGCELLTHVRDTSVMGFVEVARNYRRLRQIFDRARAALAERKPRALLLIDYPGFNLRFARAVRATGVRIVYYISPQVWAWGRGRVAKMRPLVDHLAVVFPFEEAIFSREGIATTFVGHPLLELLPHVERAVFLSRAGLADTPILALLPGSRVQEIERMLPVMLDAADRIRARTSCTVAIGAASLDDAHYQRHIGTRRDVHLLRGMTHALMQHARAAIVTSGTATVETATYGTPLVIVYRASRLNYEIFRRLINVSHIGMPNILADARIVPELVQHDATAERISDAILPLMEEGPRRTQMLKDLAGVRARMGTPGAAARVAALLLGEASA